MKRFCLLAIALIAGCQSGPSTAEKRVVGDYKGIFRLDNGGTRPGANLTMSEDHSFRELYGNVEIDGKWSIDGDEVKMKVDSIGGKPVLEQKREMLKVAMEKRSKAMEQTAEGMDRPVVLSLAADGSTLTAKHDEAAGGYAVYSRQ